MHAGVARDRMDRMDLQEALVGRMFRLRVEVPVPVGGRTYTWYHSGMPDRTGTGSSEQYQQEADCLDPLPWAEEGSTAYAVVATWIRLAGRQGGEGRPWVLGSMDTFQAEEDPRTACWGRRHPQEVLEALGESFAGRHRSELGRHGED